jgi:hypothetical protein
MEGTAEIFRTGRRRLSRTSAWYHWTVSRLDATILSIVIWFGVVCAEVAAFSLLLSLFGGDSPATGSLAWAPILLLSWIGGGVVSALSYRRLRKRG